MYILLCVLPSLNKGFTYLLTLLVNFIGNRTVLDVCDFSLGGSTEPPKPPLDPPQFRTRLFFTRILFSIPAISILALSVYRTINPPPPHYQQSAV